MKSLCECSKKEVEKRLAEIMRLVDRPRYICCKCARAANDKELLCKPRKIKVRVQT
jgi:hypothetical protein